MEAGTDRSKLAFALLAFVHAKFQDNVLLMGGLLLPE